MPVDAGKRSVSAARRAVGAAACALLLWVLPAVASAQTVTDEGGVLFKTELDRLGGTAVVGPPITGRFQWDGFTVQAFQRVVFQWRPECRCVMFVNVFDRLHELGHDEWLLAHRQTPRRRVPADPLGVLEARPAIKAAFQALPLEMNGLPTSEIEDMGNHYALRAQRVVFQEWKEDVPWARKGEVTVALGGQIALELGALPLPRSHDWRSPGFVAAVGGALYDPDCRPLGPVGANVPNLPFRGGAGATLDFLHRQGVRWLRVFATGHSLGPERAPADAAAAIRALVALFDEVDAFNARRDPAEALRVLVALTDYYPPGVPGDRHAFDHPTFKDVPVLPAPWFRAGASRFGFEQEHDEGRLADLPNYQRHYRPWVEQVVPALAGRRSLMGWQLGNELKARGSPRNGISSAQAYGWYLDFTRDVVDLIRAHDRDHLIFMGAQYVAELVDWEYRPRDGLDPAAVAEYWRLVDRALGACGRHCWNVWGLTAYDANPYPIDDATVFGQAGVAVVATEYGYTLDPTIAPRYGGDRAAALLAGHPRPWPRLDGALEPRQWSAVETVERTGLDGLAPWGAPAPGIGAELDGDPRRGVTTAPDAHDLWAAWSQVAGRLNAATRLATPSTACLALDSRR